MSLATSSGSGCRSRFRSAWSRPCSSRRWWCSGRRVPRSSRGSAGGRRPRACSTAGEDSPTEGLPIIARAGQFPDFPEEQSRAELDRELSAQAAAALAAHEGIEGGYLVDRFKSFLGTVALEAQAPEDGRRGADEDDRADGRRPGRARACRRSRPT